VRGSGERAVSLGTCVALPLDASGAAGAKQMAEAYMAHETSLDILVNNAGTAWGAPFAEFPRAAGTRSWT
jgi:NAD(P)-dependent dehydrogenase (short-subunit alcohol dehydrogenase family)